jgi:1-aminocyclopropane-1-carboxylate deaminase/D-cysteine desulfhydrase-like pyridoxal-dependent ACC family enzyme
MENKVGLENLKEGINQLLSELTPVEEYKINFDKKHYNPVNKDAKILLKRDDKFVIGFANGGKLRQAVTLLLKNKEKIISENNGSVVCSCSIKSPQSGITATACKLFGFKCNIVTFKTKEGNSNLTIAKKEGAEFYGSPSGYNSVIDSYAKKYFPNDFFTKMGFSAIEIIDANVGQVENIPDVLDYLVIAVGSAMNLISVLKGIEKYHKKVRKIIGVWVGKEPFSNLERYYGKTNLNLELVKYDKPYGTWVDIDNCFFDPIYEAKAYDWLLTNLDCKNNKVMLWVIGKRNLEIVPESIIFKEFNNDERRLK